MCAPLCELHPLHQFKLMPVGSHQIAPDRSGCLEAARSIVCAYAYMNSSLPIDIVYNWNVV